jgi:hypothetical protein
MNALDEKDVAHLNNVMVASQWCSQHVFLGVSDPLCLSSSSAFQASMCLFLCTNQKRSMSTDIFSNVEFYHKRRLSQKPWRRGVVVIVSANRTEDRGFEYRQEVRFLGLYKLQCSSYFALSL